MPALHVERSGAGSPLVLAHGFTQTGRLWGPFGTALAAQHELWSVDLAGHAGSSEVRADLTEGARLLIETGRRANRGEPFDLLGYSLGARLSLLAALRHPGQVRRLVLIGATPGIEDAAARHARRARDEALADELEGSGDVAAFVDRWLAGPMFAHLERPEAEERRRNTAPGLASSLRLAGTGTQPPLWGELCRLGCPVLVLAGQADVRFAEVGRRMARLLPDAVVSLVPGAGHAAHLEQPQLTVRLVEQFLGQG